MWVLRAVGIARAANSWLLDAVAEFLDNTPPSGASQVKTVSPLPGWSPPRITECYAYLETSVLCPVCGREFENTEGHIRVQIGKLERWYKVVRARGGACILPGVELELDPDGARLVLLGEDGEARWSARLEASTRQDACFREAFLWRPGGVACVGAGEHVWLFDLVSGVPRLHLDVDRSGSSFFGHFGHATLGDGTELLVVLTYTDVIAIDASLSIRWTARNVAIDGITGADGCRDGDLLVVHAEMDPPGGWFEVTLDARTGRELARTPSFSPGYVGIHGVGPAET